MNSLADVKKISQKFQKKALQSVGRVGSFFSIQPPKFEIQIADSRAEFNRLVEKQSTPRWLVGMSLWGDLSKIVLLHPNVVANEGVHRGEDMERVLIHELVHLFFKQIYPLSEPFWLKEGIAVFLSDQHLIAKFNLDFFKQKIDFPSLLSSQSQWEEAIGFGPYGISGKFVEFLINEFGRDKFNLFINNLPKDQYRQTSFLRKFKLFYKDSLPKIGKRFLDSLEMKGGENKNESRI